MPAAGRFLPRELFVGHVVVTEAHADLAGADAPQAREEIAVVRGPHDITVYAAVGETDDNLLDEPPQPAGGLPDVAPDNDRRAVTLADQAEKNAGDQIGVNPTGRAVEQQRGVLSCSFQDLPGRHHLFPERGARERAIERADTLAPIMEPQSRGNHGRYLHGEAFKTHGRGLRKSITSWPPQLAKHILVTWEKHLTLVKSERSERCEADRVLPIRKFHNCRGWQGDPSRRLGLPDGEPTRLRRTVYRAQLEGKKTCA